MGPGVLYLVAALLMQVVPFGGYYHLGHALWYLLRQWTLPDTFKTIVYNQQIIVPATPWWQDSLLFTTISTVSLISVNVLDYNWVPLVLHLTMGYSLSNWYVVLNATCLVMYLRLHFNSIWVILSTCLWSFYRGEHRRRTLCVAGVCHLVCHYVVPQDPRTHWTAIAIGFMAAEAKVGLMYEPWTNIETVTSLSTLCVVTGTPAALFSTVPTISNISLLGWSHRWRFTDKVWFNLDSLIVVGIICTSLLV